MRRVLVLLIALVLGGTPLAMTLLKDGDRWVIIAKSFDRTLKSATSRP